MQRRALLGALGTTLAAGCATIGPGAEEPSPSPAPVPTDSPSAEPPASGSPTDPAPSDRAWSLVEFDTLPVTASLVDTHARTDDGGELELRFVRTATADHPATVRGVFRNANPFANTFELRGLPLFRNVPTAWPGGRPRDGEFTYRDELVLAPTDGHELAETVPDRERADDGRWRLAGEVDGPWFPDTYRLAAGESFAVEYALVGRREGTGFPRARYQFEGYDGRSVTVAVWSTDEPGPEGRSRFAGADPPALPEAESMAWAHDAAPSTVTYLRPTVERAELPAKLAFTFVNHSRGTVSGNPYFWRLWKRVDGRWFHVAPWGWPMPLLMLPPGGTRETSLAAFAGEAIDCDSRTVGHLGGGRYAYEVGLGREGTTHAALLDLEAPAATIEPTDGLDVTRDGDVVRVRWPRHGDEVPAATLELRRADASDARLIPEQVMQARNAALRNTLPLLEESIEQVTLVTDRNTVSRGARTSGYEDGTFRFELRGQAYEAAAEFGTGG
ncbi:MAG: hypothetical protein U5J98_01990 [Halobacteriales archaeon]|nr:hypothetical protein [Halobacteriales archaeon]